MTDQQENKLSMFEAVELFLTGNAAALASVTQIAGIATDLESNIDDIIEAEAIATEDTTGFTADKAEKRLALETITLKVSRACTAYFLSINNIAKRKLADMTATEISDARDNDLYVKAKGLYALAHPVEANLTNFNSGPADVTALHDEMEEFFAIIQLPKIKRGEKSSSGITVDSLMTDTSALLDQLDIYMDTFASNEGLFNQYESARAIDDTGSSAKVRRGNIAAGEIRNADFHSNQISESTQLEFAVTGAGGPLEFYFVDSPTAAPVMGQPVIPVNAGATSEIDAAGAGYSPTTHFLNIRNASDTASKWRVRILS